MIVLFLDELRNGKEKMRVLDLFSGIGGFGLAARWMGWKTVQFVEIDLFCQAVLRNNFNDVPIHGDIKTFDGKQFRGTVDLITGGFPCQKFSLAGMGEADLSLWFEMFRVCSEVRPSFIVVENVYGLLVRKNGLVFERVCSDLESEGYQVQPFIIPACATNAPHRRDRIWFLAYSGSMGRSNLSNEFNSFTETFAIPEGTGSNREQQHQETNELDSLGSPFLRFEQRFGEPAILGVDDGLPKRLDAANRLKACGNAIHPKVAYEIYKAIEMTMSNPLSPHA